MALISCPECTGRVSTRASACPHCGLDITKLSRCAECETLLLPDASACGECGCPTGVACPECATVLPVGTDPCTACGCPIGDSVQVDVPHTSGSAALSQQPAARTGPKKSTKARAPLSADSSPTLSSLEKTIHQIGEHRVEMVKVPAGKFYLGHGHDSKFRSYWKSAEHTYSYWIATQLVTVGLYREIMGEVPMKPKYLRSANANSASHEPVQSVPFKDAIAFCEKLSEILGLSSCFQGRTSWPASFRFQGDWIHQAGNGMRLPLSAEWERAARAGRSEADVYCSREPNSWGLCDLAGAGCDETRGSQRGEQHVLDYCRESHSGYLVAEKTTGKRGKTRWLEISSLDKAQRDAFILKDPIGFGACGLRGHGLPKTVSEAYSENKTFACIRLARTDA